MFARPFGLLSLLAALMLTACVEDPAPKNDDDDTDAGIDLGLEDAFIAPDPDAAANVPDAAPLIPDAMAPAACESDDDCPGSTCEAGECGPPECAADADCGALAACLEGACMPRCLGQLGCDGGRCIDNICFPPECVEDVDCGEGRLCRGVECIDASPCVEDNECGEAERCVESNCEPLPGCVGDRHCAANEICEEGHCRTRQSCAGEDACVDGEDCVGGRCVPFVCRGDVDCGDGESCRAGVCQQPMAIEIATVVILNRPRVITIGQRLQYRAVGLDLRGDIVQTGGFSWAVDDAEFADIDEAGLLTGGPGAGETGVRAGIEFEGEMIWSEPTALTVVELAPADSPHLRLTDAITGSPIEGALVRVGDARLETDAAGMAPLENIEGEYTLSVFADGYDYITLVGLTRTDIHLPLTPLSDDTRVAGFTGTMDFDRVTDEGETDLGLAGASLAGGLTWLNLDAFIGAIFNVPVNAGPLNVDAPLPGGLTLSAVVPILGRLDIKTGYNVTSTAGFRLGWAFAGRIQFNTLLQLFNGGGGGGFSVGQVLATVLPFFDTFQHDIRVAERLVALPRLPDQDDVDGDGDVAELVPDYDRFPVLNMKPGQNQSLRLSVEVPELSGDNTVALLFAGVELEEVGFVPLGLSSATEAGVLAMRMAPPYAGLEAGEAVLVSLSTEFGGGGGGLLPQDISARFQRYPGRIPADVVIPPFMPLPVALEWDPALRSLTAGAVEGASLHRAVFSGGNGRWVVYFAGGTAPELTIPFPPEGSIDLAAASTARVEAIELRDDLSLDTLVGEGGAGDLTDLDRNAIGLSRASQ